MAWNKHKGMLTMVQTFFTNFMAKLTNNGKIYVYFDFVNLFVSLGRNNDCPLLIVECLESL